VVGAKRGQPNEGRLSQLPENCAPETSTWMREGTEPIQTGRGATSCFVLIYRDKPPVRFKEIVERRKKMRKMGENDERCSDKKEEREALPTTRVAKWRDPVTSLHEEGS